MSVAVVVHLYAAAKAAVGASELRLDADPGASIGDLVLRLSAPLGEDARRVLQRCSYLVNGRATTDPGVELRDGDRVDLLPPFAGG